MSRTLRINPCDKGIYEVTVSPKQKILKVSKGRQKLLDGRLGRVSQAVLEFVCS